MQENEGLHQRVLADLKSRFSHLEAHEIFSFDEWRAHTNGDGGALTGEEQLIVVDQAIATLQKLYVHMDLKRTRHGVDPVRQLLVFREQLGSGCDPRRFHNRMLQIFKTLGDVHTAYRLPAPWKDAIAFLPFILGSFVEEGNRRYVVTRTLWDDSDWGLTGFERGTEVVSWNGTPIDEAVQHGAEFEEGSTAPHDLALGLQFMTVRWLGASFEPDSPWVIVGYRRAGEVKECRFFWTVLKGSLQLVVTNQAVPAVFAAGDRVSVEALRQERSRSAHTASVVVHRGRQVLFVGREVPPVSEERLAQLGAALALQFANPVGQNELKKFTDSHAELQPAKGELPSLLPSFLEAREHEGGRLLNYAHTLNGEWSERVRRSHDAIASKRFGYLGIRAFPPDGQERRIFKYELRRLLSLMPEGGLIIDIRDNPGGSAELAEQSLQFLTPKPIAPLPFRFIASAATKMVTGRVVEFKQYGASIENALSTGAAFSAGVPISTPRETNALGQFYFGPVVLVTNGVTYSAGDIFAAGFEDNNVGSIVGVDETTGGGGANCWFYEEIIRRMLEMPKLPRGINLQVAVRQCARIGSNNLGIPIEEVGVTLPPANRHTLTRDDILGVSRQPWSLLLRCAAELAEKKSYKLEVRFSRESLPDGGDGRRVTVTTRGIERLDYYVNGRPTVVPVENAGNGRSPETSFVVPMRTNQRLDLKILGYAPGEGGDELVARCVRVFHG